MLAVRWTKRIKRWIPHAVVCDPLHIVQRQGYHCLHFSVISRHQILDSRFHLRPNIASHQPDLVHVDVRRIEGFPSCIAHLDKAGAKRAWVTQNLRTADTQMSDPVNGLFSRVGQKLAERWSSTAKAFRHSLWRIGSASKQLKTAGISLPSSKNKFSQPFKKTMYIG